MQESPILLYMNKTHPHRLIMAVSISNNMGLDMRKPVFRVCEQQRDRPACASAQSDQGLCYSLLSKLATFTGKISL